MVQRGDVVKIKVGGVEHNALVHQVNEIHEPKTLHVSYVAEDPIDNNTRKPKVMPIGYIPESKMIYDCAEWDEQNVTPVLPSAEDLDTVAQGEANA